MDHSFWDRFRGRRLPRRIVFMLCAVVFMGFGVSLFVWGAMGADPFSTLNLGVSSKIGLSFGTWQAIFNCALLVLVFFFDRGKLELIDDKELDRKQQNNKVVTLKKAFLDKNRIS